MQFCTGLSIKSQSKSYTRSFTECVWDFQNNAWWDTDWYALLWNLIRTENNIQHYEVSTPQVSYGDCIHYIDPNQGRIESFCQTPDPDWKNSQKDKIYSQNDANYSKIMKSWNIQPQTSPDSTHQSRIYLGVLGIQYAPESPCGEKPINLYYTLFSISALESHSFFLTCWKTIKVWIVETYWTWVNM